MCGPKMHYSSISRNLEIKSSTWSSLCKIQANQWLILSFLVHIKIQYKEDLGGGTALPETPEMERVKRNQRNISTIQYKDSVGQGTAIPDLPEMKRVRETQKNISLVEEKQCSDPYLVSFQSIPKAPFC
uniref:Uncharacterized protein n=1 Tax=Stegastes partitus TaxID=144197 RepID=A0A3B5AI33_9TELE